MDERLARGLREPFVPVGRVLIPQESTRCIPPSLGERRHLSDERNDSEKTSKENEENLVEYRRTDGDFTFDAWAELSRDRRQKAPAQPKDVHRL